MKIISDEKLSKLTENDLIVKEYEVFPYFVRTKLNCGLYAYIPGYDDCVGEYYGKRSYWFYAEAIDNIVIVEQPTKEELANDKDYEFMPDFLEDIVETGGLDKTSVKYFKLVEIAKSIIKITRADIYFSELHDYVMEVKRQIKEDFTKTLAANSSSIRAAIERVKKRQAERVKNEHDKSNPQESVLQKSSKEELSGQNEF